MQAITCVRTIEKLQPLPQPVHSQNHNPCLGLYVAIRCVSDEGCGEQRL